MLCTRCGASAVVKRGEQYYCGECALKRDWEEIISVVQDTMVGTPVAGAEEHASR